MHSPRTRPRPRPPGYRRNATAQPSEPPRSLSSSPSLVASFRPGMLMSSAPSGETPWAAAMARMAAWTNCWWATVAPVITSTLAGSPTLVRLSEYSW